MIDYDLESHMFKKPLHIFYTDKKHILSSEVSNMDELIELMQYIKNNDWELGVGAISIELQLWFAVAREIGFFKTNDG